MASKILRPAQAGPQLKSLTIKIPAVLAERLAALQERANAAGMIVDLDGQVGKALARLVRVGEQELLAATPSVTPGTLKENQHA